MMMVILQIITTLHNEEPVTPVEIVFIFRLGFTQIEVCTPKLTTLDSGWPEGS